MGNAASSGAIHPPQEYTSDEEHKIPFEPDGNDPVLNYSGGTAIRVKPTSPRYANIKLAVRKTIRVTETQSTYDSDGPSSTLEQGKNKIRQLTAIISRLRHPHMLKVITTYFYTVQHSVQFSIVIEYAEQSLRDYLMPRPPSLSSIPRPEWFGCLIDAVAYIHQHGIQHKDIRPESIMIKDGTTILLGNFDISELDVWQTRRTTAFMPQLAAGGMRMASSYKAPEMEEEQGTGPCGGRAADIFSLGAVFLEMLVTLHCEHFHRNRSAKTEGINSTADPGLHAKLESFLRGSHGGFRCYAHCTDAIGSWISGIIATMRQRDLLEDNRLAWESRMFSLAMEMLDTMPNARPRADELSSKWGELLLSEGDPYSFIRCSQCPQVPSEVLLDEQRSVKSGGSSSSSLGGRISLYRTSFTSAVADPGISSSLPVQKGSVGEMDACRETALFRAAGCGDKDRLETLLHRNVEVLKTCNVDGWSALHYAARNGKTDIINLLLPVDNYNHMAAESSLINLPDGNMGWTPLHFAARNGRNEVLQMLLDNKANVQAVDKKGHTALHLAAKGGHKAVVDLLLSTLDGAADRGYVNARNKDGHTALYFASLGGHREVLKTLVGDQKVDVRAPAFS